MTSGRGRGVQRARDLGRLDVRTSGVLLHPTSLPGPWGQGDLGTEARRFIDFLAASGQSWWQMLPVNPPGPNGPYSSPSAFAGSPLLLSPERLRAAGLVSGAELAGEAQRAARSPRAGAAARLRLLGRASEAFLANPPADFEAFCAAEAAWLDDHALFEALRAAHHGGSWLDWPRPLAARAPRAIAAARRALAPDIARHKFAQYAFKQEWQAIRDYGRERGVALMGDLPIYVALECADVWANRELFELDRQGRPRAVAGVPPDAFSSSGQLWGNPLFRWGVHRQGGYAWWLARLRANAACFDAIRLDHFIGFVRYWSSPAGDRDASRGRWRRGPGADFLSRIREALPELALVVEDLGSVGPDVTRLRDAFDIPGMLVLQFAFGEGSESSPYLPHNHVRRSVVYTGTHDHETMAGWASSARHKAELGRALRYMGYPGGELHWEFIRLALSSVAATAIVPAQDLLGLGSSARMNRPGTSRGNWTWRLRAGQLADSVSERLRELTELYGRRPTSARRN